MPLLLFAFLLMSQAGKLVPVNDAPRDKTFNSYLNRLRQTVAKRDGKALQKLVHPEVVTGGFAEKDEKGWDRFTARWQPEDQQSPLWDVLADLLDLGFFRAAPQTFVSPYVAWKFPRDLDPRRHWVVVRDNLPLLAEPRRDANPTATLHFDIVRRVADPLPGAPFHWLEVETLSGQRGYVQQVNVRSPLMERAQFQQIDGRWGLYVLDRRR
jgi:hypothetical protein